MRHGTCHVFDGGGNGAIQETYWGGGNTLTTYQLANVGIRTIATQTEPDRLAIAAGSSGPIWTYRLGRRCIPVTVHAKGFR